jgi:hypothetical protein
LPRHLVARRASARRGVVGWGALVAAVALLFGVWRGAVGLGAVRLVLVVVARFRQMFAAMILGHWCLVTPKLPEAPLILLARALLVIVIVRSCSSWFGRHRRRARRCRLLVAGRTMGVVRPALIVGLIFPLIVCWASVQTARTRSMESATGLLYINVGSIAAGTILAAGLYFGAGLLV